MKKTFTHFFNYNSLSIAIGLLFVSTLSVAQIDYTDVNPNATIAQTTDGSASYEIDLDGDQVLDFVFVIDKVTNEPVDGLPGTTFTGYSIGVEGLEIGDSIVIPAEDDFNASSLSSGTVINKSNLYSDVVLLYLNGTYTTTAGNAPITEGNFNNSTGKYLGVRFVSGGNSHFGYIGINTTGNSFTIRDFAFEQTKDVSINAGELPTSVSNYINSNTTIKNINNTIIADFTNHFNGKMEIVNINGQVLRTVEVSGISSSINMEGVPSGIYQVVISGSEGYATKRVFVSNQ